jgi:hypothetical protein
MKPGDFQCLRVFCSSGSKRSHPISIEFYLGNIPIGVAEIYVNELLYKIDNVVSMRFMTDRHSFQPKWSSFVEMASETEAKKVVEAINGKMLSDRPLTKVKRNLGMPKSKLCSFCISTATCKKVERERKINCKDYMLQIDCENERLK